MSNETPNFRSPSNRLLQVIPVFILVAFVNVFISCCTAGVVLIQLLASGHNRYLSLGIAILISILVHGYLIWNHIIRNYIKKSISVGDKRE